MTAFSDFTVAQLLDALSSPNPTPGGGTAAAIAGAMGTSLLIMVTGLAKSRSGTEEEKTALAHARAALVPMTSQLTELADADTRAFDRVMAAYRLPKNSDDEKAARTRAIQDALKDATTVPLQTLRACADALAHAGSVARHGNRSAASDAGVAVALLKAAADGAHANVQINLDGIKDDDFKTRTGAEARRLTSAVTTGAAAAMHDLA
jgi:methenyltetrahydrofolate cyclohydrolase